MSSSKKILVRPGNVFTVDQDEKKEDKKEVSLSTKDIKKILKSAGYKGYSNKKRDELITILKKLRNKKIKIKKRLTNKEIKEILKNAGYTGLYKKNRNQLIKDLSALKLKSVLKDLTKKIDENKRKSLKDKVNKEIVNRYLVKLAKEKINEINYLYEKKLERHKKYNDLDTQQIKPSQKEKLEFLKQIDKKMGLTNNENSNYMLDPLRNGRINPDFVDGFLISGNSKLNNNLYEFYINITNTEIKRLRFEDGINNPIDITIYDFIIKTDEDKYSISEFYINKLPRDKQGFIIFPFKRKKIVKFTRLTSNTFNKIGQTGTIIKIDPLSKDDKSIRETIIKNTVDEIKKSVNFETKNKELTDEIINYYKELNPTINRMSFNFNKKAPKILPSDYDRYFPELDGYYNIYSYLNKELKQKKTQTTKQNIIMLKLKIYLLATKTINRPINYNFPQKKIKKINLTHDLTARDNLMKFNLNLTNIYKMKNYIDRYPDRFVVLGFSNIKKMRSVNFKNTQLDKTVETYRDEKYLTFNDELRTKLRNIINRGYFEIKEESGQGSDVEFNNYIKEFSQISLYVRYKNKKYRFLHGGFFNHIIIFNVDNINDDINLEKYGLYREVKEGNYIDNCLFKAFKESNKFNRKELHKLKSLMRTRDIPKVRLKEIANKMGCCINLKYKISTRNKVEKFNEKSKIKIDIGLLNGHYFIIDNVKFTSTSLKLYDKIKHLKNWNRIIRYNETTKKTKTSKKRFINSYEMVDILLQNSTNLLKKITIDDGLMKTQYYDKSNEIKSLDYDEENETMLVNKNPINYYSLNGLNNNHSFISYNNRVFKSINERINYLNNMKKNKSLEKGDIKLINNLLSKLEQKNNKIFFDIETYNKRHINPNYKKDGKTENEKQKYILTVTPYLCCAVYYNETTGEYKIRSFIGKDCIINFLKSITNDTTILIHNAGFDARQMIKYLLNISLIEKNNKIMGGRARFYNIKLKKTFNIKIKDTLSIIPLGLSKFQKTFGTVSYKDILPYGLYDQQNIGKLRVKISKAVEILKRENRSEEEIKEFLNNIDKYNLRINNVYFDHLEYSRIYCEKDCITLMEGYLKFRGWINEIVKKDNIELDIDELISSSTFGKEYLRLRGCFDGCYKLCGNPRKFIQNSIIGGRVMTRNNKKHKIEAKYNEKTDTYENVINDFDAVSLYPSAMNIMGFLKGKPKVLNTTDYNIIKKYDGYFVDIKITQIKKRLNFPLISYINDDGIRDFTDDIDKIKNRTLTVDKTTLEDFIKYQKIEYEIIRGYYYNEGRNYKIQEVIKDLFNERKKKKAEGNKIQEVYKLIMNSAYGKTIMKPIETENVILDNENDFWKFYDRKYNFIKESVKISGSDKYLCKVIKPIHNHFSSPHIGSEVLSTSKRIMNKVICFAEDIGLNIYYQDTDSIHIKDKDICILANVYKSYYGKDLIGKNMGQFHSDFDFESDEMPVAVNSIFLSKKSYIDVVKVVKYYKNEEHFKHRNNKEYIKKNNLEEFKCECIKYYCKCHKHIEYKNHIRMKGVPNKSILKKCEDLKITPLDLYEKLLRKEKVEVNLLCYDSLKLEYKSNYTINKKQKFTRTIHFPNE
jgi:hypothetical protein